jgi:hypothetical protein
MAKRPLMDVSELAGEGTPPPTAAQAHATTTEQTVVDEPVVTLYIRAPQSVGLRLKELIHRRTMARKRRQYQNDVLLEAVTALLEKEGV